MYEYEKRLTRKDYAVVIFPSPKILLKNCKITLIIFWGDEGHNFWASEIVEFGRDVRTTVTRIILILARSGAHGDLGAYLV